MTFSPIPPTAPGNLGEMLKFLRRRARLSQRQLSIAVGYSESHISRIENNERPIDRASLLALFVPALEIQNESETIARLLALCEQAQPLPADSPSAPAQSQPTAETQPAASNRLPAQLTSFIGRREELAEICALLADRQTRLLTLTGAGGCGKTRLALAVGEDLAQVYSQGVWLVELASLADPQLLAKTVASAFQLNESSDRPLLAMLADFLHPRQALLILDNCEHLVDVAAHLAATLLQACPGLQILATSRETLAIPGETIYRVQPLALPPALLGGRPAQAAVEGYDAIRLFVERAGQARRGFALSDQNAPAIARICQRLDGIPLAIELAAAWIELLTPEQLAARLERDFELLIGHSRAVPLRHQTLAAAIDWSYDLLPEKERLLLRRVSVFAGSWGVEAAESVAGGLFPLERKEILGLLDRLVGNSLVVLGYAADGGARFRLLETIRAYGWRKLAASGEEEQVRDRHLAYFAQLAQKADADAQKQESWLAAFDAEQENLRAALDWTHAQQMAEKELQLAAAIGPFWRHRGHYAEGRQRLAAALEHNPEPSLLRAQALLWAGILARSQGKMAEAQPFCAESLALFRRWNDGLGEAQALENLGWICSDDDRAQAVRYFQESLAIYRSQGRTEDSGRLLTTLGQMAREESNLEWAYNYLSEALQFVHPGNDAQGYARILNGLAELASLAGDYEQTAHLLVRSLELLSSGGSKQDLAWIHCGLAENCWHRCAFAQGLTHGAVGAQIFRELGSDRGLLIALHHLGLLWLALGKPDEAGEALHESLLLCQAVKESLMTARCLAGLAGVALCRGEANEAARLLAVADQQLTQQRQLLTPADHLYYNRLRQEARGQWGESVLPLDQPGYDSTLGENYTICDGSTSRTPCAVAISRSAGVKPDLAKIA